MFPSKDQHREARTDLLMPGGWRLEAAVFGRAAWLWFLLRLALVPLLLAAGADPILIDLRTALILIALTGMLSWLDTRSQNEDLLLANLGTSRSVIHALGVGAPLVLECLVATVGRL